MSRKVVYPGVVDWSGDNPGIALKMREDGPFTTMASFFRIAMSPHGRGHALILLRSPGEAKPPAAAPNLVLSDNPPLARWLVDEFAVHFGVFRGQPGLPAAEHRRLDSVVAEGDMRRHSETIKAGPLEVRLEWNGLGDFFALEAPPHKSATERHTMLTLFAGAREGVIAVNGERMPGMLGVRVMGGQTISSAFLAFSEIWIRE